MHLLSDEELMPCHLVSLKSYIGRFEDASDSLENLRGRLKSLQRTRHLALWHDHSTIILGAGYLLMTVHVLYDSAVFLNYEKYKRKTGENLPKKLLKNLKYTCCFFLVQTKLHL